MRRVKLGNEENASKIIYVVSLLPALFIMILIFSFSAKTAVQSSESSNKIAETVVEVIEMVSGEVKIEVKENYFSQIDHIIRKLAHITEYAVLAMALGIHLAVIGMSRRRFLTLNIVCCALYAATDEIHQLFVDGRGGRLFDVGIDTIGASLGTLFFLFLLDRVRNKIINRNQCYRN